MKGIHSKKSKKPQRRAMDEDFGRQAQLWWMLGVGVILLLAAYYENMRPLDTLSARTPAQISSVPSGSLPYRSGQFN
ncbi:MAG: hypothetical protein KGQ59_02620 [Bdellovibrionales bacterium]|nr:hypothetical protein [Bdellovibrionales bacterium]